ncbi:MAG: Gx transporter family protein [Eubacterium sp.]
MKKTKKLVIIALYTALALILSYLEALIPIPLPIPGAKIGLPNCITLMGFYTLSTPLTLLILIARILLSGFLFGNFSMILYALTGGLLSFVVMWSLIRLPKNNLSPITISIFGALTHNLGQLCVAALVVQNSHLFFYYFPFLMLIAIPTGLFIGITTDLLLKALKNTKFLDQ